MRENYKCSCCKCWWSKKDLDHISHSTNSQGDTQQYIQCKECEKLGCLVKCKYMPS